MTQIAYNRRSLSVLTVKPLGKGSKWGTVHALIDSHCIFRCPWHMMLVVSLLPAFWGSVASTISLMVINLRLHWEEFGVHLAKSGYCLCGFEALKRL